MKMIERDNTWKKEEPSMFENDLFATLIYVVFILICWCISLH